MDKMEKKGKKGELTSKQLVTIIILIISFAIIIAFFVMLGLKTMIGNEVCRNSVMMRNIPFGSYVFSLKCKTENICFTLGGDCDVKTDTNIKVENDIDLLNKMVELKENCWWMMGEGKVDYGNSGDCAICYKVSFDKEIQAYIPRISPNREVFTNKTYAVVTRIDKQGQIPPSFIEFNATELNKFRCSNFVTEI